MATEQEQRALLDFARRRGLWLVADEVYDRLYYAGLAIEHAEMNLRLRPKILALKPGTRIVSNSFTMEDWEADGTVTLESGCVS